MNDDLGNELIDAATELRAVGMQSLADSVVRARVLLAAAKLITVTEPPVESGTFAHAAELEERIGHA